ncbi:hypothetical protein IP68_08770 [Blastomonas sp. AAP25]|jgi:hypothetical protein|uniref:hypothetical protein n=1 Tax=Blastomonas sp. AAP25 TaxID=1523416 RepID=UPI0006B9F8C8|nr:hypothetical protein [Blastomonas sp. AAP25]KPF75342.1 hypothetical protein IP68_08770 [Blastomonas sp. AAP25]
MLQPILWLLICAVHVLPAAALFQPGLLAALYGMEPADPAFLLVQHRAALFACVVVVCIWAIFDPGVRRLAAVVAAVSMVSFLVLFWSSGAPASLRSIALVDLAALPLLIAAGCLAYRA